MEVFTLGSYGRDLTHWYSGGDTCYGICIKEGKILLCCNHVLDKEYQLMGGRVGPNESHRECLEKVFWDMAQIEIKDIKPLCDVNFKWRASGGHPIFSKYHFYIIDTDFSPHSLNWSCYWVDINDYKDYVFKPYIQKAIDYYIDEFENLKDEDK